jgi:AraC-like DNA-binding protein
MVFQVHIPTFPLNRFIERLFYYEGINAAHTMDRFLPDGNAEIIIDLTEGTQFIYDNETLAEIQACRYFWASGVRTQPITIPSGNGSRILVVAFKRGRAYPFYPIPVSELTDHVVSADLIFRKAILDLREQLLAAASIHQMFLLVERFLFQCAMDRLSSEYTSRCIEYAVSSIVNTPNRLSFQQLSEQIGYSQKHFINLFKCQVGVTPKQYLKIMRFQQAVLEMEIGQTADWSHFAQENGYYDQSHFINEFKCFSGFTPGEYMQRKTDTLNYVPVD